MWWTIGWLIVFCSGMVNYHLMWMKNLNSSRNEILANCVILKRSRDRKPYICVFTRRMLFLSTVYPNLPPRFQSCINENINDRAVLFLGFIPVSIFDEFPLTMHMLNSNLYSWIKVTIWIPKFLNSMFLTSMLINSMSYGERKIPKEIVETVYQLLLRVSIMGKICCTLEILQKQQLLSWCNPWDVWNVPYLAW